VFHDLIETERLGSMAVREACKSFMEKWSQDGEQLSVLANALLQAIDRSLERSDKEMTGTYLCQYSILLDFAKEHLNRMNYHYFCEHQEDWNCYL